MKTRTIDLCLIALVLIMAVLVSSCGKRPVMESTSSSTVNYVSKTDTNHQLKPDSSMIKYLIECQETADGYLAVIKQITEQQPGAEIPVPTSEINGDTLTTRIFIPGKTIKVPVYRFYSTTIKAAVYIKTTNILNGKQRFFVGLGKILGSIVLLFIAYMVMKLYTKIKLPF